MKSVAESIYPKLKPKPEPVKPRRPPADGWAPQRAQWGEVDHRVRGAVSPLGGTVKRGK
jgi:hypothetical protein